LNRVGNLFYLNGLTLFGLVHTYPKRVVRFILHFIQWIPPVRKFHLPSKGIVEWLMDLFFYLADVLIFPDLFELIFVWFQTDIRLLNEEERSYAKKYFENQVNLYNVRMSRRIPVRIKNLALAFVTFNTIHFAEKVSIPIFVHELVHIWQYQKFGSVYIYRALKAQRTKEGYDYGGLENLYAKMLDNALFTEFNFEQQGAIFEDYCRMMEASNVNPPIAEASYEYFVGQVRGSELI